jgi:hypothetical protein
VQQSAHRTRALAHFGFTQEPFTIHGDRNPTTE